MVSLIILTSVKAPEAIEYWPIQVGTFGVVLFVTAIPFLYICLTFTSLILSNTLYNSVLVPLSMFPLALISKSKQENKFVTNMTYRNE